jgi:hypothetical protein
MDLDQAKVILAEVSEKFIQMPIKIDGGTLTVQKAIIAKLPLPFESLNKILHNDLMPYDVSSNTENCNDCEVLVWAKWEAHDSPSQLFWDYYWNLPSMFRI